MSGNTAIVAFSGFVGFNGTSVRLHPGDVWNLDDPKQRAFYDANRDKFAAAEPEPVRPVLPKLAGRRAPRAGRDG
ncbi:hypothetical protein QTQ03_25350 [Micromonospora sp. WMMA1363]|uniref:hypothetical protein n=1 Tax=Micromonospora sp. WMMA1363 TaxID=3053985 RepID=UPI00259C6CD2|nr:hypothetical protein [Micromonospora sp. WMMA1363]MDM4722762.1 hypothetical protein [Micromonospora sp. WMMA1363]